MKTSRAVHIAVLAGALLVSCASSEQLTVRSQRELNAGQPERAYQTAIVALKRRPDNAAALVALEAAAHALEARAAQRAFALAAADTLAAARALLDLQSFRIEVARHGGTLPRDPDIAAAEHTIRTAAAARQYADGAEEMQAGHPKSAYRRFLDARAFAPGYRDVEARVQAALDRASARLVILPFEDESGIPGLAEDVRHGLAAEVEHAVRPDQLTFTTWFPQAELERRMTVDEQRHMTREMAVALGRRIGAGRVMWGRIASPRTDSRTDRYEGSVYRREERRDSLGNRVDRFVEVPFTAVRRERRLSVHVTTEIINVDDETSLAHSDETPEAAARTVYTSYMPEGECDRYCLVPPAMRSADSDRADRLERGWHDTFGSWTVPGFLECARQNHGRRAYRRDFRGQFATNTMNQPVFLDDLPDEGDLMRNALDDLWRSAVSEVREQDEE